MIDYKDTRKGFTVPISGGGRFIGGSAVRQPSLTKFGEGRAGFTPAIPIPDWYCPTCGEAVSVERTLFKGQMGRVVRCKAHDIVENALWVGNPTHLEKLIKLYTETPPAVGGEVAKARLRAFKYKLSKFCYGCRFWESSGGGTYRCAKRERTTGSGFDVKPSGCQFKEYTLPELKETVSEFKEGDTVYHGEHGEGMVYGRTMDGRYTVNFPRKHDTHTATDVVSAEQLRLTNRPMNARMARMEWENEFGKDRDEYVGEARKIVKKEKRRERRRALRERERDGFTKEGESDGEI